MPSGVYASVRRESGVSEGNIVHTKYMYVSYAAAGHKAFQDLKRDISQKEEEL